MTCNKCGQTKALSEFRHPRKVCRECDRTAYREWYAKNQDKRRAYQQGWTEKNPDYFRNHAREWRKENPEKVKEHKRLYAERHPDREYSRIQTWRQRTSERRHRQHRQWQRANPDKVLAQCHKRRAKKLSNGGSYTAEEWKTLCNYYDNRCLCCGKAKPLTVDHVIPITKGGSNSIENLQPLCRSCNSKKHDKIIDYRKGVTRL